MYVFFVEEPTMNSKNEIERLATLTVHAGQRVARVRVFHAAR